MKKLDTAADLAVARFGRVDGLALVQRTTLEMAKFYAERFGLDIEDPEVSLISSVLAFTRHKELTLLMGCENDIHQRVLLHPERDYTVVLFNLTRSGGHRDIHREIDRLHARATRYIKELKDMRDENTKPE